MGFMLVRLQLKYGQVPRFTEVMPHLVEAMEKQGWELVGSYVTRIGRFHEVWDLWDLHGDAAKIGTALDAARHDPEFARWAAVLPDIVEEEEIRYVEKLSFSP
jgi:NIPSNAP